MSARILCLLAAAILLLQDINCASRARPGGGPVDKTPPEIIYTFPNPDSTSVSSLNEIIIGFSERMNEPSVQQSLFISPPLDYKTDWSGGDELILELADTLLNDRTYVLTIGSAAEDARKNRMTESFQLAFSTGSTIDKGMISGAVYGMDAKDIFYLYAYIINNPDSLNPVTNKADFLSQPAKDGTYRLNYLPFAAYRVFVIEDKNRNLLLDTDFERLGIPSRDITLSAEKASQEHLNFKITRVDTTPPFPAGMRSLNKTTALLRVSEPVLQVTAENLSISDTLSGNILPVLGIAPNSEEINQYFVYTAEQDSGMAYRAEIKLLVDTSGIGQSLIHYVDFSGSSFSDTAKFRFLEASPRDSARNIGHDAGISLGFTRALDTALVLQNFTCIGENGDTVSGTWRWEDLKNGTFIPDINFEPGSEYVFEIATGSIKSLWGDSLADSTVYNRFFIRSPDEYGALSGQFDWQGAVDSKRFIHILPLRRRSRTITVKTTPDGKFRIPWIDEGRYKIGGFVDLDDNSKYSSGKIFPFIFSEPIHFNSDTLRVRKRWELEDIRFEIPGYRPE